MTFFVYDQANLGYLLSHYTDVSESTDFEGVYAEDGTVSVTILEDEDTWTGLYAENASVNVVEGLSPGVMSRCGALNVRIE